MFVSKAWNTRRDRPAVRTPHGRGRIMVRQAILASLVLAVAGPAPAQQPTFHDPLLDHLVGRWVLTGTIGGRNITHDVSAEWVLNHQYLEFEETSREKNKDGTPFYESAVYIGWDELTKVYVCAFLDTYGGFYSGANCHAPRSGDRIAFVFRDRGDPGKFHNTLSYDRASDGWTMNMDHEIAGKFVPFARTTLRRAK